MSIVVLFLLSEQVSLSGHTLLRKCRCDYEIAKLHQNQLQLDDLYKAIQTITGITLRLG